MRTSMTVWMLAVLIAAGVAQATEPVGSVVSLQGTVTAMSAEGMARSVDAQSPVFVKDRIMTGADSKVQIRFVDDSTLSQGELSELVIDDYLFDPDRKDENRADFKMLRGVFHVITEKITQLNPERFKVRTNYGTIGIRGCELGFKVWKDREEVLIIGLGEAHSVVVGLDQELSVDGEILMEISRAGVLVALSPETGLTRRPFTDGEVRALRITSTPVDEGMGPDEVQSYAMLPETQGQAQPVAGVVEKIRTDALVQPEVPAVVSPAPPAAAQVVEAVAEPEPPAPSAPESPAYPVYGPKVSVASDSGPGGWSWDVWEREVTDLVGGVEETTTDFGASAKGSRITAANYATIAAAPPKNLSGSGTAGAYVGKGSQLWLVQGPLNMGVTVGSGVGNVWFGDFALSGPSASLNFDADGSIAGGQLLFGTLNTYSLVLDGASQGAPQSESVRGSLLGSGTDINGANLKFGFGHGADGATVQGAGGADLN